MKKMSKITDGFASEFKILLHNIDANKIPKNFGISLKIYNLCQIN